MDIDDSNIGDEMMPQAPNQPPISAVDAELADLIGCDIRDIQEDRCLQASDDRGGNSGQALFCPIPGCARSRGRGPPWKKRDVLRAHIDLDCIGELQGQLSAEWLQQQLLRGLRVCGRTINTRFASGVHAHYWPRNRNADITNLPQIAQDNLPSFHDIFAIPIFIKDHLPAELGLRYVANMLGCLRLSSRLIVGMLGMLARPGKAAAIARVNSARAGLGLSCLYSLKRSVGRISGDNVATKP